jgi:hypothetical protein
VILKPAAPTAVTSLKKMTQSFAISAGLTAAPAALASLAPRHRPRDWDT